MDYGLIFWPEVMVKLTLSHSDCILSESDVTYGSSYSEFVLCIYHPRCAHTQQWTHTHTHTHTVNTHPEQWAAIYAAAPGEQLGVRWLAQGHLKGTIMVSYISLLVIPCIIYYVTNKETLNLGIEGGESAGHSLHDSNLQPLDYKSNSLIIRPWLPI